MYRKEVDSSHSADDAPLQSRDRNVVEMSNNIIEEEGELVLSNSASAFSTSMGLASPARKLTSSKYFSFAVLSCVPL